VVCDRVNRLKDLKAGKDKKRAHEEQSGEADGTQTTTENGGLLYY